MTQTPAAGNAGTDHELTRLHGPNGSRLTEPHMTADEVARLFSLTPRTVRKYARTGEWPHARTPARGGGIYLFCTHDIDEIVAAMGHAGRGE